MWLHLMFLGCEVPRTVGDEVPRSLRSEVLGSAERPAAMARRGCTEGPEPYRTGSKSATDPAPAQCEVGYCLSQGSITKRKYFNKTVIHFA